MSNITQKNIFTKNAVLYKEMTINMKQPKILVLILIFNVILFFIASGFLITIGVSGREGAPISYRTLATMLIVLVSVEAGALCISIPAFTGSTVAGEKERQTLDVLLTTRLTPFDIVLGKFLSIVLLAGMVVLSSFPILALVFIYGGINFFQLLGLVMVIIFEACYIATFGIFFSSSIKRTAPSVVLSYVVLGFLVFGTLTMFGLIYGITEAINSSRSYMSTSSASGVHADWSIFLLLFNPGVTFFDCIGTFLGAEMDDVVFQGMKSIVDLNYIDGDNFVIRFWTPITITIHAAIMFGLLKASAHNLSPVKNTKKREREYDIRNMKKVGVQPDFEQLGGVMPQQTTGQAPQGTPDMMQQSAPEMQQAAQQMQQAMPQMQQPAPEMQQNGFVQNP